jgi:hypothetical protein
MFSNEMVVQRARDILCNLLTVTNELKVGILGGGNDDRDGKLSYWMELWTHALEEMMSLRHYPSALYKKETNKEKELIVPNANWPGIEKAVDVFRSLSYSGKPCIIRYGEKDRLQRMFDRGEMRINPASSYDDPSLNYAVKDNELEMKMYVRSPLFEKIPAMFAKGMQGELTVFRVLEEMLQAPSNYYAYCMSMAPNIRLFGDFKATACIIATDPERFVEKIVNGCTDILNGWVCRKGRVRYVDPIRSGTDGIDVLTCKHFRFTYQDEYRLAWVPATGTVDVLEPFDIELGDLHDCCELLIL